MRANVLADEAEARRRLEVRLLDLRHLGRRLGEGRDLAVADAPPEALCTTTLGSVESSPTGTPHFAATASSSTRRACAPAMRSDMK